MIPLQLPRSERIAHAVCAILAYSEAGDLEMAEQIVKLGIEEDTAYLYVQHKEWVYQQLSQQPKQEARWPHPWQ